MKYSTAIGYPERGTFVTRRAVFDTHPLSRLKGLEKKNRFLSVACYFGLAPFLWFSGVIRQQNTLLNHHLQYSLAFSFTVFFAMLLNEVTSWIQYWMTVSLWNPTMAEFSASPIPIWIICESMVYGLILLVSIWAFGWCLAVVGAWRGRTPRIPVISWIASNFKALKLGVYWSLSVEVFLALFIGLAILSTQIANAPAETADVYVLYTVGGYIPVQGLFETFTPPRWAVTMAFYPLVQAGMKRYGDDSVRILPLSEQSFNEAIHNGRFIFVASHGGISPGGFTISGQPYKEYLPRDVAPGQVGERLEYVYFAGCWTGDLETEWRQVLRLEDAIMFHRLSFVDEHMRWVWFKSPRIIAGLDS